MRRLYMMRSLGTTESAAMKSCTFLTTLISCSMAARNSDKIRYSSRGENASPNRVMMVLSRKLYSNEEKRKLVNVK